ncbi:MAG: hypothetical protein RLZZ157_514, partial [Pseudomonadota bacterium]
MSIRMKPLKTVEILRDRLLGKKGLFSARGIAATEFALVLPVMILMLFGATEVSKLITVDRKTTVATATLADLSSQNEVVTCKELAGVGAVTRQVYEPYSGNDAVLTIGHIVIRNNAAVVEWSKRL